MEGIIYMLTSPSGKSYIGQTINPRERYACFLNKNKNYGGSKINRARKKYGPENFKYEILEKVEEDDSDTLFERLNDLEIFYIEKFDTFNNGYNLTKGGTFNICYESIEKMSNGLKEYYKDNKSSFFGKHHTEETKKVLSEIRKEYYKTHESPWKGCHPSEEVREKISESAKKRVGEKNSFFGKHHTEETKKKISDANSIPILQLDKDTNEVIKEFSSMAEAERYFGVKQGNSTLVYVCKNKPKCGRYLKTWKGYKWVYKKDYEGSTTIPEGSTLK